MRLSDKLWMIVYDVFSMGDRKRLKEIYQDFVDGRPIDKVTRMEFYSEKK